MATTPVDTLNSLLRGELSATETYQQALKKLEGTQGYEELKRVHREHREAANTLRQEVHKVGGKPDQGSGAWGAFAKAVEGMAKAFGTDAALKALKEGEEHGVKEYENALNDGLTPESRALIESKLLPETRAHVPILDRLMAGLVKRIPAREAHERVASGRAMLVCAYDSPEKFEHNHLEGAISLKDFESQASSIPKDREIIFYCA
jgi:uncharacterized protein (TIGR02284 family)